MKKGLFLVLVTAVTAFFVTRELFPRTVKEKQPVPVIETVYDTVEQLPEWYQDSLDHWKRRAATTDTVNLVFTNTIVDTEFVPVNAEPEDRPDLWPVLGYRGSVRVGDTAIVSSYSIRDGRLAISKLYIPGVLTALEADTGSSVPKITFQPFPPEERHNFLYGLKMVGIGAGVATILGSIF